MNPMTSNNKLILIKVFHTLIWIFYNVVIFYLLYAVIANRINKWVWICNGLVVFEGIVLAISLPFLTLQISRIAHLQIFLCL